MANDGTIKIGTEIDESGIESGAKGLSASTIAIGNLAAGAVSKIAGMAADAAKFAVSVGSSFEAEMDKVAAISGASGADFDRLTDKAKELGSSTIFSASEVAQGFEYMGMAGWKTEDMLSGIDGILNLAAASGEDLAVVSDIVTDALTAFGLEASDASHFSDVLANASTNANTNVTMLGESFKYVAPVAGSLGFSVEDTALALGLMANSGIKASQAGTALRSALSRMVNPTGDNAILMEQLGLSLTDSSGQMKSMDEVMSDLRVTFGGMEEAEKASVAAQLFGQEAMSGMLAIINASDEEYNNLKTSLESCDGAASSMAATMQDNLSGKMTALSSATEGLGIAAYNMISGPLATGVEFLTDVVNGITDILDPPKTELEEFLSEIASANEETASLISSAQSRVMNADMQVDAMDAYLAKLLELNPVQEKDEWQKRQISNIVSELSTMMPELAAAFDSETGSIQLTNQELVDLFTNNENLIKQQAYSDALATAYEAEAMAALNLARAEAGAKAAQEAWDQATGGFTGSVYELNEAIGNGSVVVSDVDEDFDQLALDLEIANGVLADANTNFSNANAEVEMVSNALESLNGVEQSATTETQNLGTALDGTASSAEAAGEKAGENYVDAIHEAGEVANQYAEDVSDAADTGLGSADTETTGEDLAGDFSDAIDDGVGAATVSGYNLSAGTAAGITAGIPLVVSAAQQSANAAIAAFKNTAQIRSPSRVMKMEGGFQLMAGAALGVDEGSEILDDAMIKSARNAIDSFGESARYVGMFRGSSGRMISSIADGLAFSTASNQAVAQSASASGSDVGSLSAAIASALNGTAVNMDGRRVGELIADTVDSELGANQNLAKRGVI